VGTFSDTELLSALWLPLVFALGVLGGSWICRRLAIETRGFALAVDRALERERVPKTAFLPVSPFGHQLLTQMRNAKTPLERRLAYNDWVEGVSLLRDRATVIPKGVGRICLMTGVALAVVEVARSLQGARVSVVSAGSCLVVAVCGLGCAGICGARARSSMRAAAEGVRRLKSRLEADLAVEHHDVANRVC